MRFLPPQPTAKTAAAARANNIRDDFILTSNGLMLPQALIDPA
jgi:hypothetical protein